MPLVLFLVNYAYDLIVLFLFIIIFYTIITVVFQLLAIPIECTYLRMLVIIIIHYNCDIDTVHILLLL